MAEPVRDEDFYPDPDDWRPKDWYCYNCCVTVALKTRCKYCGKREKDKS